MFRVLFVCTANVVRSPAAVALARHDLPHLTVRGAGTHARDGDPMSATMARVLAELGVRPPEEPSARLRPALVDQADLVLTMDAAQRDAVLTEVPRALRRTFTLGEFARLAGPGPLAERVAAAACGRGGDTGDIADPRGAAPERYRDCAVRIRRLLASALAP